MEYVSPLRSVNRVPCTRLCLLFQNSSGPYPKNPLPLLRDVGGGVALIEVSSFILFFRSEFSSFTVFISSSISVNLVLNSSTSFCRFCNISNVDIFVLMAAFAASDDEVATPMVIDIME